jgi:hypothetical protein
VARTDESVSRSERKPRFVSGTVPRARAGSVSGPNPRSDASIVLGFVVGHVRIRRQRIVRFRPTGIVGPIRFVRIVRFVARRGIVRILWLVGFVRFFRTRRVVWIDWGNWFLERVRILRVIRSVGLDGFGKRSRIVVVVERRIVELEFVARRGRFVGGIEFRLGQRRRQWQLYRVGDDRICGPWIERLQPRVLVRR